MHDLRISVVSQPFCVDQLNPAGFNVPNVLIRKTPALFLRREIGNLEINMAEARFVADDIYFQVSQSPDYDISTEDSSENENKNTYTEASSDNSSSDPETESSAKVWSPQEFDDAKDKSQSRSELDQVVIP